MTARIRPYARHMDKASSFVTAGKVYPGNLECSSMGFLVRAPRRV